MKKIFHSLSARLCFYILTITVIIFTCIAIIFHKYSSQREEKQAVQYTSLLMDNMLSNLEYDIKEVEHTAELASQRAQQDLKHPDKMMGILDSMLQFNNSIMGCGIAFEPNYYPQKGKLFMEYACFDSLKNIQRKHLGKEHYNYPEMDWYKGVKMSKKGIWTEPYYDQGGGNQIMVTYTVPVLNEKDEIVGVLGADISLNSLVASTKKMRPYKNSWTFIISKKGTYIVHPDKDLMMKKTIMQRAKDLNNADLEKISTKMLKGEKGWNRMMLNDVDVLQCYSPMPHVDWSVCTVSSYKDILGVLGSTALVIFGILIIGMIALIIAIRLIVVHAMAPMIRLTDAAYKIAAGDFNCKLPAINTKDEMSKLHDAFVHMQHSLNEYVKELEDTTRSKERIESELHIARKIQMSMIPNIFSPFPEWENLELYAYLHPAKEVGGDLYDFFIRDHKLFFTIGDVSGKGVPASLVMAITRSMFRIMAGTYNSPARIASELNHAIAERNETDMFITMYFGVLDLTDGHLTYCNAGHNPPILVNKDENCSFQEVNPNLPIGVLDNFKYEYQEAELTNETALLLYTDGITEAENILHEQYGEDRLMDLVNSNNDKHVKEIITKVNDDVKKFAGEADQSDDLTMLCVRLDTYVTDPNK